MKELWRTIPNYDDQYLISNMGRIKSLKTNKLLSATQHSDGFMKIRLWRNNKAKNFLIHRLVAQAFISNPREYSSVSHIDGDKRNNRYDNLKWATQKEIVDRSWNLGISTIHSKKVKVGQYSKTGDLINIFYSIVEAAAYVNRSTRSITRALNGDFKTSGGYIWKYEGVV